MNFIAQLTLIPSRASQIRFILSTLLDEYTPNYQKGICILKYLYAAHYIPTSYVENDDFKPGWNARLAPISPAVLQSPDAEPQPVAADHVAEHGRQTGPVLRERVPGLAPAQPGGEVLRHAAAQPPAHREDLPVREPEPDPHGDEPPAGPPGAGVHEAVVPNHAGDRRVEVPVHGARTGAVGLLRSLILIPLSGQRAPDVPQALPAGLHQGGPEAGGERGPQELPVRGETVLQNPGARLLPPQAGLHAVREGEVPVQEVHQVPERVREQAGRADGPVHSARRI